MRALLDEIHRVPVGGEALFQSALPAFGALLGAPKVCAFRVDESLEGRSFGFFRQCGFPANTIADYGQYALRPGLRFAAFTPRSPERSQRNRVFTLATLFAKRSRAELPTWAAWPRIGIGGHDQIRVVLCDGDRQLAFLGAYRQEPFGEREVSALRHMTSPLVQRLALERRLEELDVARAGLVAALDAIASEAAIVRADGSVAHANGPARAAYDRCPAGFRDDVDRALFGDAGARFEARPLALAGPPHYLLVRRAPATEVDERVAHARKVHALTDRQCEVLARVVRGDANKLIASDLACSEKTIETHVTFLLRKMRCGSRAELVSKFWRTAE